MTLRDDGRYYAIWYGRWLDGVTNDITTLKRASKRQPSHVLPLHPDATPPLKWSEIPKPGPGYRRRRKKRMAARNK